MKVPLDRRRLEPTSPAGTPSRPPAPRPALVSSPASIARTPAMSRPAGARFRAPPAPSIPPAAADLAPELELAEPRETESAGAAEGGLAAAMAGDELRARRGGAALGERESAPGPGAAVRIPAAARPADQDGAPDRPAELEADQIASGEPPQPMIVEDDVAPAGAQMTRSEFLSE